MDPLLLEPIECRIKLIRDWALCIEQAHLEAARCIPKLNPDRWELLMGIQQQVKRLGDLLAQIRISSPQAISEAALFGAICDAYSLYPGNHQVLALIQYIWRIQDPESYLRLATDANRAILYVHISCQKRIHKAAASAASFGQPRANEAHLIVVGSPSHQEPGLGFHYADGVLTIPVGDWYESHYQKTLYTFSILCTLLHFERLLKLDDDVTQHDRSRLDQAIAQLQAHNIHYAGTVGSWCAQNSKYNGWHIHKCHNKDFERRSITHLSSGNFAMGGLGYQLSYRSTQVIRNRFMSNPIYYRPPQHILMEDEIVGLMLSSEKIPCEPMLSHELGLQIEAHRENQNQSNNQIKSNHPIQSNDDSPLAHFNERLNSILAQPTL